jgi:hypothetical protein
VFAPTARADRSAKYTFVPSAQVVSGLMSAGFVPVEARQARTRSASPLHAKHIVRFRRRFETIALRESVPEICFVNSHDGSSRYELRTAIYRAVCSNGLVVSHGTFPAICVAHRGNVVDEIVAGALKMADRFDHLAAMVQRMEARILMKDEQLAFATRALALKYPGESGMAPVQLLTIRRPQDVADDLYTLLNRVQENVLRGGLARRAPSGRLTRTRRVTSIRRDLTLNTRLWDLGNLCTSSNG